MERDEAWEPTTRIPVLDEDILEVCTQSHLAWHHSFAEGLMFTAWKSLLLRSQGGHQTKAARQCSHCSHAVQQTQIALQLHCSHITGWTVASKADKHCATIQRRLYVEYHMSN